MIAGGLLGVLGVWQFVNPEAGVFWTWRDALWIFLSAMLTACFVAFHYVRVERDGAIEECATLKDSHYALCLESIDLVWDRKSRTDKKDIQIAINLLNTSKTASLQFVIDSFLIELGDDRKVLSEARSLPALISPGQRAKFIFPTIDKVDCSHKIVGRFDYQVSYHTLPDGKPRQSIKKHELVLTKNSLGKIDGVAMRIEETEK